MSACYVGFDTSNYTTSEALAADRSVLKNQRILLSVEEGERGLRQSDAVFQHTKNLPDAARAVGSFTPLAVGCSVSPRDAEGSYMPCFLCGIAAATVLSSAFGVPLYRFSHQAGHVAAALYSAGRLEELYHGEFLAFHVSGGTTELLHVKDMVITRLGGTLDISAGKLVDRTGVKLGLTFPCGPALEALAADGQDAVFHDRVCVRGCDCNLSGAENKVDALLAGGASPGTAAYYVLDFVAKTLAAMAKNALALYPGLPILFAGGVMSNRLIAARLGEAFHGFFAGREYSCDNAAGIALLTELKAEGF